MASDLLPIAPHDMTFAGSGSAAVQGHRQPLASSRTTRPFCVPELSARHSQPFPITVPVGQGRLHMPAQQTVLWPWPVAQSKSLVQGSQSE